MSDDLIAAHRDIDKLMPFLHLPIQSGSNNILKGMNRKHTRQDYFKIIEKIREARPDMGLSSDFIIGFPGETDQDFEDTLDLIEKIGFSQCYSFKYSPRPGTPASDAKIQVEESVKAERLKRLQELLAKQQTEYNQSFEGSKMPVLFERQAPKSQKASHKRQDSSSDSYQLWGKSPYLQSVIVDVKSEEEAKKYFGKIAEVEVEKSRPSSLIAKLI
jgi:tRNA-2-methylthio-N6-dimethylallyladenosine synthase